MTLSQVTMSLKLCTFLFLPFSAAFATEVIVNGSFETGTLGPWSSQIFSASALSVSSSGAGCATPFIAGTNGAATGCQSTGGPFGTYAAYSSLDGFGDGSYNSTPGYAAVSYDLTQSIVLSPGVTNGTLSWADEAIWGIDAGRTARQFRVL